MFKYRIARIAIASLCCVAVSSCSLFVSGKQRIHVETSDPQATIRVDGMSVGHGSSLDIDLPKNKGHVITATNGSKQGSTYLSSTLSTAGWLDLLGTVCFLFPIIGFVSKGAWQLEPEGTYISLE